MPVTRIPLPSHGFVSSAELERQYIEETGWQTVEVGSQPTDREFLYGDNVSVVNGAIGRLTWDHTFGPNTILDRSDPTKPTVAVAGTYFFSVMASGLEITEGGQFVAWIELDLDGEDMQITDNSAPATVRLPGPVVTLTACWHIPAGAVVRVSVQNQDGSSTRNFNLADAYVQRLS